MAVYFDFLVTPTVRANEGTAPVMRPLTAMTNGNGSEAARRSLTVGTSEISLNTGGLVGDSGELALLIVMNNGTEDITVKWPVGGGDDKDFTVLPGCAVWRQAITSTTDFTLVADSGRQPVEIFAFGNVAV